MNAITSALNMIKSKGQHVVTTTRPTYKVVDCYTKNGEMMSIIVQGKLLTLYNEGFALARESSPSNLISTLKNSYEMFEIQDIEASLNAACS